MIRRLTTRVATLFATLLVASFVVFGAVYAAPGNPIAFLTGGRQVDSTTMATLRAQYHLDEPFLVRYWSWLGDLARGDLGSSVISGSDVESLLGRPAATTALLITYAVAITVLFGVGLGIVAALRRGAVDTTIVLGTTAGLAVPGFVLAIVLMSLFSVRLGWFPVFGSGEGLADQVWHLTLPAVSLAVPSIALVARLTREALREEMGREHVETAMSRGIPRRAVIRRHMLRNGMIPITAATGVTIAGLVAGSVVVERAFNLNGLGSLLITSVGVHDFPVVQAIVLIFVLTFVLLNTVVDFLFTVIDPRLSAVKG